MAGTVTRVISITGFVPDEVNVTSSPTEVILYELPPATINGCNCTTSSHLKLRFTPPLTSSVVSAT